MTSGAGRRRGRGRAPGGETASGRVTFSNGAAPPAGDPSGAPTPSAGQPSDGTTACGATLGAPGQAAGRGCAQQPDAGSTDERGAFVAERPGSGRSLRGRIGGGALPDSSKTAARPDSTASPRHRKVTPRGIGSRRERPAAPPRSPRHAVPARNDGLPEGGSSGRATFGTQREPAGRGFVQQPDAGDAGERGAFVAERPAVRSWAPGPSPATLAPCEMNRGSGAIA